MHQLLHDFTGGQVAFQPHGACGTKGAPHLATHLAGHTQGGPAMAPATKSTSPCGHAISTAGCTAAGGFVQRRICALLLGEASRCIIVHNDRLNLQAILQLQQQLRSLAIP